MLTIVPTYKLLVSRIFRVNLKNAKKRCYQSYATTNPSTIKSTTSKQFHLIQTALLFGQFVETFERAFMLL